MADVEMLEQVVDEAQRHSTAAQDQESPCTAPQQDVLDEGGIAADPLQQEDEQHLLEIIVGDGQNKYDLRPQARGLKANFSRTWIDDDRTGCYDPVAEQRRLRQRPKRKNLLLKGFCPWDLNESDEESEARRERAPKELPKLEITLVFRSEAGKAQFAQHVQSLPAQTEPIEELLGERRLRRRDSAVHLSSSARAKSNKQHRLPDGLPSDLTGHPAARGCWECLTIGIRCPLLDDERAWPCTACLDDDHECELVTAPTYKRACEHCKSKRIGCSYTYSLDHDGPCEECSRTGWHCIAGPAKEAIRERINYERDWEHDPWQEPKAPKTKKLPSCRGCRERGQPCSFSSGDKSEACTACQMADATCVPESEMPQGSRKRKQQRPKKNTGDTSEGKDVSGGDLRILQPESARRPTTTKPNPIIIDEDSDSTDDTDTPTPPKRRKTAQSAPRGQLKTISTKFAHPIKFNYEGEESCHFCSDIRFSMFGLGQTDVEVVVWNDGSGLEEVSGGHKGQGMDSTRMCVACTTHRLPMLLCAKHELRPLSGVVTNNDFFKNQALTVLLDGTATGKERWCSICPSLAQYGCCTSGLQGRGCGLQLCEQCMVPVTANDGDLQQALKGFKDEPTKDRILGLRADHEFLRQDGLLMRYVLWESQNAAT